MFGYVVGSFEENEISSRKALDDERKLRYELEQFKTKLLNSSKEAAYLAEVKERNRIAREIHDNIGHKLTGILIQLQAAVKIFDRDNGKTKAILATCISTLSDTVNLIRDTVHNIKPNEKLGVEYIKNIIKNFSFCTVNFKFTGDFGKLSANKLEIVGTNIKEALTNAAKYSKATEVNIAIDINEQYTRLYIKDNGTGSIKIKEGLGLSGMRERVQNVGGTLAVSGENGFMIVCIIPEK
jgi:signal transduction histidine kinase